MFFSAMFTHGYVPSKCMETIIVLIIKDNQGLITDKDNYCSIAITSEVSQIVELILLEFLQN